jgi:hypothetical protein
MVVVMKEGASDPQVEAVIAHLVELGMDVHRSTGASRIVLGVVGGGTVDPRLIELMDGVHEVLRITQPYKLASRTFQKEDTIITICVAARSSPARHPTASRAWASRAYSCCAKAPPRTISSSSPK